MKLMRCFVIGFVLALMAILPAPASIMVTADGHVARPTVSQIPEIFLAFLTLARGNVRSAVALLGRAIVVTRPTNGQSMMSVSLTETTPGQIGPSVPLVLLGDGLEAATIVTQRGNGSFQGPPSGATTTPCCTILNFTGTPSTSEPGEIRIDFDLMPPTLTCPPPPPIDGCRANPVPAIEITPESSSGLLTDAQVPDLSAVIADTFPDFVSQIRTLAQTVTVNRMTSGTLTITESEAAPGQIGSDVVLVVVGDGVEGAQISTQKGDGSFQGPPFSTTKFSWGNFFLFHGMPSTNVPMDLRIDLSFGPTT